MANAINVALLNNTATQYRQELIALAVLSAQEALQHMSILAGVQHKIVLTAHLKQGILKPYNKTWNASDFGTLVPRTLEVGVGKVELEDEPEQYRSTYLGAALAGRIDPNTHPFELFLLEEVARQVSEDINLSIFNGKQDSTGTTPMDVFDGFNTHIDAAIAASDISVAKGNMHVTGDITSSNAVDKLKGHYRAAHKSLRNVKTKMYISHDVYDAYVDDYQATNGGVPYNQNFDKTFLEGSKNLCELVPLSAMGNSKRVILSLAENMCVGVDQVSDAEDIRVVELGKVWVIGIAAKLVFGTQIGCIDQRLFLVNDQPAVPSGSGSI